MSIWKQSEIEWKNMHSFRLIVQKQEKKREKFARI